MNFDTKIILNQGTTIFGSLFARSVLRRCGVQEREPGVEPLNHHDCLFRICPPLSFKAQRETKPQRKVSRRASIFRRASSKGNNFDSMSQSSSPQNENSSVGGGVDREAMRAQQELLQNRAEMEKRQNNTIMERTLAGTGNVVQYGAIVMLQHVQSGLFVGALESAALKDADCRRVNLSFGDSGCGFRLLPRYRVRSEGSAVYYGDAIILESVAVTRHYLHVSPILYDESLDTRSKQPQAKPLQNPRTRRTSVVISSTVADSIRPAFLSSVREYEANTSPNYSTFTIVKFSRQTATTLKCLNTMERFRLYSPQAQAFIHASCDTAKENRLSAEGPASSGPQSRAHREFGIAAHIPYLRRIENSVDITNVRHISAKGVWTIEFESRLAGGSVEWASPIRIRHVASGKYLCVRTTSKAKRQHHVEDNDSRQREDWYDAVLVDGQVSSKPTGDADRTQAGWDHSGTVFYLQANEHTTSPHVEHNLATVRVVHRFKLPAGRRIRTCYLHDAGERKPAFVSSGGNGDERKENVGVRSSRIVFSTKRHTEDVFTLLQVDSVNTLRLDRILSCIPVAKLYTYLIESKSRLENLPTAKDVEDEIQMLLTVIADCNARSRLERWLEEPDWVRRSLALPAEFARQFYDEAQPLAQRFCRETKLIDAIFDVTVSPYTRFAPERPFSGTSLKGAPETRALRAVQKLAYVALQRMFAHNEKSQMYFARSTTVLKAPSQRGFHNNERRERWIVNLTQTLEDPLGSAVTLSELLSTNEELLHTFVTDELVNNFASMIEAMGPQPRLINFFAKVCAVAGKPIKTNQEKVLRRVFMFKEKREKLLLDIIPKSGEDMDFQPHEDSGEIAMAMASLEDTTVVAKDYLAKVETRDGRNYPGVFVKWAGSSDWAQHSEALYLNPGSLGIETAAEGGLVRIEEFCWVLTPRKLCLSVTGEEFDSFMDSIQGDTVKLEAYENHRQLAQYFSSQLDLFCEMALGRSCKSFSVLPHLSSEHALSMHGHLLARDRQLHTLPKWRIQIYDSAEHRAQPIPPRMHPKGFISASAPPLSRPLSSVEELWPAVVARAPLDLRERSHSERRG